MREILFRGKRIDNGDFVFGMPWIFEDHACICPWDKGMCKYDTGYYPVPVIPETVGQYTGLTDKNGRRIFEGDMVKVEYVGGNTGLSGTETVAFHDGMFGYFWGYNRDFVPLSGFVRHTFEVVGNIHDNPEKEKGQG